MSEYIPPVGHLTYVHVRDRIRMVETNDKFGSTTIEKLVVKDNSYSESIFKCLAVDDTLVVCSVVHGGYSSSTNKPYLFRKDQYQFTPVGPTVAKALNLEI